MVYRCTVFSVQRNAYPSANIDLIWKSEKKNFEMWKFLFLIPLCTGGYLFDNHAPEPLPVGITPRGGGEGIHLHDSSVPRCGERFGAGLLGRGHSSVDLDSNTEFGEYPWHVAILSSRPGEDNRYSFSF